MIRSMQTLYRLGLMSVVALGGFSSFAPSAQAGFKWVSPVAPVDAPAPTGSAMSALPPVADDPVLVIEGTPYQPLSAQTYTVPSTMATVPSAQTQTI